MFAALRMFFATLTSLFSATEKLANAANHAASFVEGEAAHFNNKTTLARVQEIKRLNSTYSIEDQEMARAEAVSRKDIDKALPAPAVTATAPSTVQ